MRREKSKGRPPEDESTDARHRDGTARSSEEAPVMGVERRGCVVQGYLLVNQEWEESVSIAKPYERDVTGILPVPPPKAEQWEDNVKYLSHFRNIN
jgi:hypothetical protein